MDRRPLDYPVVSDNTEWTSVRFTQSARRHRIGRASARHGMATVDPTAVMTTSGADAWLWVGVDERGREIEIIGIEVNPDEDEPYLLVLHVMPLRFRR